MRRRYRLILIIFISFLLAIGIYFLFHEDTYIYLAIGSDLNNNLSTYSFKDYINEAHHEEKYIYHHHNNGYLTLDNLLEDINKNSRNLNYYLKNANLITISLGTEELYNYEEINEDIILEYLSNMYILLNKIRHLNKNKIFIINLYDDNFTYINQKVAKYAKDNDICYIDKKTLNLKVYTMNNYSYLNYKGHKDFANLILEKTLYQKKSNFYHLIK